MWLQSPHPLQLSPEQFIGSEEHLEGRYGNAQPVLLPETIPVLQASVSVGGSLLTSPGPIDSGKVLRRSHFS